MLSAGVVGGTGYTGVELLRLLVMHPEVELTCVTSRSEAGSRIAELFPNLRGHTDIAFTEPDVEQLGSCDIVFFATPNGTAMKMVPALLERGARVIDLAADFRLKDEAEWAHWYGMPHACPELLAEALQSPALYYDRAGVVLGAGYNLLIDYFFTLDYRFDSVRAEILQRRRDPEKLRSDVASMRAKMRQSLDKT